MAAWFFGEDQGRYLVTCTKADANAIGDRAHAVGSIARWLGETGGEAVRLDKTELPLAELRALHEGGFARMMGEV